MRVCAGAVGMLHRHARERAARQCAWRRRCSTATTMFNGDDETVKREPGAGARPTAGTLTPHSRDARPMSRRHVCRCVSPTSAARSSQHDRDPGRRWKARLDRGARGSACLERSRRSGGLAVARARASGPRPALPPCQGPWLSVRPARGPAPKNAKKLPCDRHRFSKMQEEERKIEILPFKYTLTPSLPRLGGQHPTSPIPFHAFPRACRYYS